MRCALGRRICCAKNRHARNGRYSIHIQLSTISAGCDNFISIRRAPNICTYKSDCGWWTCCSMRHVARCIAPTKSDGDSHRWNSRIHHWHICDLDAVAWIMLGATSHCSSVGWRSACSCWTLVSHNARWRRIFSGRSLSFGMRNRLGHARSCDWMGCNARRCAWDCICAICGNWNPFWDHCARN